MDEKKKEKKVCIKCEQEKPLDAFREKRNDCRECEKTSVKQRMERHNKTLEGKLYVKYNDARRTARKHGVEDTLTREELRAVYDYYVDKGCPYCSDPITEDDFSLDHIVSMSRGGPNKQANIVFTHKACNLRKRANPAAEYVQDEEALMKYMFCVWDAPVPLHVLRTMIREGVGVSDFEPDAEAAQ